LRALARPERADLLVMGTHGYAGLDRLLAGSVAEAVIRRARIPVLAVPEHTSISDVARVLAPWNGRPYATRALRWARELSRSLCATLDVLQVKESEGSIARDWRASDRRLTSILGAGPDWMLRTRAGDARKRIIAEANSGRYELVVLAAHRRPFAADFVLGSTVERLLRHCEVPILAVPSGPRRPRLIRRLASRASARLY
jgi:nucleotide-binding universal stress UspA family protein